MSLLKIVVVTDSRGGRNGQLEYYIKKHQPAEMNELDITVVVYPGADFGQLISQRMSVAILQ